MVLKNNKRATHHHNEMGGALVYILLAIALLAALTASFMRPASQQTTAQSSFKTITSVKSQIEFIRSNIQECVLTYPSGDDSLAGVSTNFPFPINPSSTYYDDVVTPAANDNVSNIRCPGNPGNTKNHAAMFAGSSGKFLPPAPNLFEEWEYYNGVDGVFFFTSTDKSDAFLQTAMEKLDGEFSSCQADIVDATSAEVELTSTENAGDPKCADGSTCFRVWMITKASAVFTDGSGCP